MAVQYYDGLVEQVDAIRHLLHGEVHWILWR